MIKVSTVVSEILYSSEVALTAFNEGILNYSAYAKAIKKQVQDKAKKPATTGSITVALSRLAKKKSRGQKTLLPNVKINDLTVKSPLIELTYDKTSHNFVLTKELYKTLNLSSSDFLEVTQGNSEITIIASQQLKQAVMANYKRQKPKSFLNDLVALTVTFDKKYIHEPNVIYSLIRNLALKRINIVELVSTYTELTFILHKNDLQEAFVTLNGIFQQN